MLSLRTSKTLSTDPLGVHGPPVKNLCLKVFRRYSINCVFLYNIKIAWFSWKTNICFMCLLLALIFKVQKCWSPYSNMVFVTSETATVFLLYVTKHAGAVTTSSRGNCNKLNFSQPNVSICFVFEYVLLFQLQICLFC